MPGGDPLTNARIVLKAPSQRMYIEALRQGQGIGMMAREIMQRYCPERLNVMSARREPADIWLAVNPDVWSAGRVQATLSVINECFKNGTLLKVAV
ncbi:hypothetical protein FJU30_19015 [Affinibrenneria salicis]|uniref:LysR substrate-binding domain-containing protein n=1 Tax=Affinibrenneria salicis TaxID=2590031 RepID=A0A5J5FUX7_9GAMM|nr:hypothetical protein [Affinibrenneria salicis]KAA8997329.1 hypothetical protein FJU30_19015 [Affinibrenneria salicis]